MTNLMIEKTRIMLSMQDEMNRHVDIDWLAREREWYRAIWIECAELMDHYGGWKWWKHAEPDYAQVLLEIVDIWHFGLSLRIDSGKDYHHIAAEIIEQWETPRTALPFLQEVEYLALAALEEKRFAVGSIRSLLDCIEDGFDGLYRAYVAKNVLNIFRQDHGYKSGGYVKIWDGREDNEVLTELMAELDSDKPEFRHDLYRFLDAAYARITAT